MFYNQQLNESYIASDVNDISFLQEAYFGKNPILLEIEAEFQKIIDSTMSLKHLGVSKPVARIEELTTELFNFKSVTLGISNIMSNAMAIGADAVLFTGLEKGEYGVRFKKPERHGVIIMDINLSKAGQLNASEMTAIYLHEVGHLLYTTSVYTKLFGLATFVAHLAYLATHIPAAMIMLATGVSKDIEKTAAQMTAVILSRTPYFAKIGDKIAKFMNNYSDIRGDDASMLVGIIRTIKRIYFSTKDAQEIIKSGLNTKFIIEIGDLITLPYKYSHEKFADNFATAYGYGPELASGLSKLHNKPTDMFQNELMESTAGTVFLNVVNIFSLPAIVVSSLTDPHPSAHNRIKDQIAMVRFELNKSGMNPLLIADLKKDLDKLESTMERNTQAMENIENNKNAILNIMAAGFIRVVNTDSVRDSLLDLFRVRDIATHQIDIKK